MSTSILEGPASVIAANEVRALKERHRDWPYPWSSPPPSWVRVTAGADSSGTLAVPAPATPTQALLYTVPQGYIFALQAIVVEYLNSGVIGVWNPGDAKWSLTVNKPVGVASFQGNYVQGFTNVDVPLGTLQIPWPLVGPELFEPNDAVRVEFTNTNLAQDDPNFIKAILLGWRWPVPMR